MNYELKKVSREPKLWHSGYFPWMVEPEIEGLFPQEE